jgi:multidrug efflux pump subunit AcrA (membrane-fusion protein)
MKLLVALLALNAFAAEDRLKEVFTYKAKLTTKKELSTYPVVIKTNVHSIIKAPINGVVRSVYIKLGQKVKAGQLLMDLRQQSGDFDYRPFKVRATVSGVISQININKGEYVSFGAQMMEILDPKKTFGRVEIPVSDHALIKDGQKVELSFEQIQGKKFSGLVDGVSVAADPLTGTLTSNISIADAQQFPIGIVGKAVITRGENNLMLIEDSALNYEGEKVYVKVIDEKKIVSNKYIKIGAKENGKVQILEGLKVGEEVIVRANGFVAKGDKVEVVRQN